MEYLEDCVGWMAAGVTLISYISPIIPYINLIKGKIYDLNEYNIELYPRSQEF